LSLLKKELLQQCIDFVQNRIDNAEQAIKSAQQASNDDTKSSAGDKYETSREMMQQDTNRNLAQLTEASKLMQRYHDHKRQLFFSDKRGHVNYK
jgi:ribosome-binding ATPase YchF (GTP1/OBG family)